MKILGLDLALRTTGYGVVRFNGSQPEIIDCGIIKNKSSLPHSECLRRLGGGVRELIEKYKPNCAAIESPFYAKNAKTAMLLSCARGAVILVLAENSVPIYEYSPRKAKQAIGGCGSSSKAHIATILASMLGLNLNQIPPDSTDAIAIAICHGQIATKPSAEQFLKNPL